MLDTIVKKETNVLSGMEKIVEKLKFSNIMQKTNSGE